MTGRLVTPLRGVPDRCDSCGQHVVTHMVKDPGMPVALVCSSCVDVAR